MENRSPAVDRFMDGLTHSHKDTIERLRIAILASDPQLSEQVKWNAPSFVVDGVDRVTFRLQPGDRVQLILHRGVKVRADAADFAFADDSGLITWAAPDRGVVTIEPGSGPADADIVDLVTRWIAVPS